MENGCPVFEEVFEENVFIEENGSLLTGSVKFGKTSLVFKQTSTTNKTNPWSPAQRVLKAPIDDIQSVEWTRLAEKPALQVRFGNDATKTMCIGGFPDQKVSEISALIQLHWKCQLDEKPKTENVMTKANGVHITEDGRLVLEVLLDNTRKCTINGNDVSLQFCQDENSTVKLTEMRFQLGDSKDEKSNEFREAIKKFAKMEPEVVTAKCDKKQSSAVTPVADEEADLGPMMTSFPNITCTSPRGRFDVQVYENHLVLHGKTTSIRIPTKNINELCLVPSKDGRLMYFVISANPPVRKGQTRHNHIVFEILKSEAVEIEIDMDKEKLTELYGTKLEKEQSGAVHEILSKVCGIVAGVDVSVCGQFGQGKSAAIACALKHASGFLYPMDNGFLFLHKPITIIKFDDVLSVFFPDVDKAARYFEFDIQLENGQTIPFSAIEREEYHKLRDFIQKKQLHIRNTKDSELPKKRSTGVKRKAEESGATSSGATQDDDSDEEDEDYAPKGEKKKMTKDEDSSADSSSSEPDDEYDSNFETSDEDGGSSEEEGEGSDEEEEEEGDEVEEEGDDEGKEDTNEPTRKRQRTGK